MQKSTETNLTNMNMNPMQENELSVLSVLPEYIKQRKLEIELERLEEKNKIDKIAHKHTLLKGRHDALVKAADDVNLPDYHPFRERNKNEFLQSMECELVEGCKSKWTVKEFLSVYHPQCMSLKRKISKLAAKISMYDCSDQKNNAVGHGRVQSKLYDDKNIHILHTATMLVMNGVKVQLKPPSGFKVHNNEIRP